MSLLDVVEADPIFDHAFGLEPVLQIMQVYGLLFEGSPQPFDEDKLRDCEEDRNGQMHGGSPRVFKIAHRQGASG